jgi:hypothetical protein
VSQPLAGQNLGKVIARKQFWELIEHTHRISNGEPENQAKLLIAKLTELSEKEILSYQVILDDLMDEAYIVELGEMAYNIDAGCRDDGFMDFRAWLIGQGKHGFEQPLPMPKA